MATKVLYIGNGKWCYTRSCKLHAREIQLVTKYTEAVSYGDSQRTAVYTRELLRTHVGIEAYRYLRVQELSRVLGHTPTIAIDVDNTTGDFTESFREFMGIKYKVNKSDWLKQFPDNPDYDYLAGNQPWFGSRQEFLEHLQEAEHQNMYRTLQPFPNAKDTLEDLKNYGFNIRVVTARGIESTQDTRQWLQTHRIPFDELIALGNDEKQRVQGIDVYIDDSPRVLANLIQGQKRMVVMNHPYNEGITGNGRIRMERVDYWGDNVVNAVFDLLTSARKAAREKEAKS